MHADSFVQTNSASNDSHKCLRKVYVGIPLRPPVEGMPLFMIIPELVGPNRQYTDHIGSTTQTSVQLRGFGSGCTGENSSQEPLHFAIGGSTEQQVTQAESLAQNLIATVRSKREQFYQRLRVPVPGYVTSCVAHARAAYTHKTKQCRSSQARVRPVWSCGHAPGTSRHAPGTSGHGPGTGG